MSQCVAEGPATAAPPAACRECGRRHRGWETFARCVLKPLYWIEGDGRWASVSDCPGGGRTVKLFDTEAEARAAVAWIDRFACGGQCCRFHRVVDLVSGRRPTTPTR